MILTALTAELVASYIEAFATLSAVLLALFLQVYLVRAKRPRLFVEVSGELADEDKVALAGFDPTRYIECYLRVKVWAARGKRSANGTRAFLLKLERPNDDAVPTLRVPDCLFKWSGPSYAEDIVIPPGTWRRLDVLRYRQEFGSADHQPILVPALNRPGNTINNDVSRWPPSPRNRLDSRGDYVVEFVISCDDGNPTFWRLTFNFAPAGEAETAEELAGHILYPEVHSIPAPKPPRRPRGRP